ALLLHGIEPLPTALKQDSNQSNDDFSAANRGLDQARNLHISPEGLNLCSLAGITDEIGTAHRDAQTVIALCEHPHDVSAEKSRPAEDSNESTTVRHRQCW